MADKNIQMRKKNANGTFDNYFPITKAENVIDGARIVTGSKQIQENVSTQINLGFKPRYVKYIHSGGSVENIANDIWMSHINVSTTNSHFVDDAGGRFLGSYLDINSIGFSVKFPQNAHITYIAIR